MKTVVVTVKVVIVKSKNTSSLNYVGTYSGFEGVSVCMSVLTWMINTLIFHLNS